MFEDHLTDDLAVPQDCVPADGDINTWRLQQRRLYALVLLLDQQPFDAISPAPPSQIDVFDMALIVAHVGHLFVQIITHQMGQGEVQHDQQQAKCEKNPQGKQATGHGIPGMWAC